MNTENNKIIAEFLCTTQKTEGLDDCYILKSMAYHIEDLKFNTDWNWLMEVVEKIESLDFILPSQEYGQYKAMKIEDALTIKYKDTTKIEAVYNACVEFIKWYNENKFGSVK
jgi:hypothetical protein